MSQISNFKSNVYGQRYGMHATRVYIAGPMRGIKDFNFPAFEHAAKVLRGMGFEVITPHEEDIKHDGLDVNKHSDFSQAPKSFAHYMKRDLALVCDVDAIAVLPGWGLSEGAQLEVYVARKVGKTIFDADTLQIIEDWPDHKPAAAQEHSVPIGLGGAPLRASTLPADAKDRKAYPIASGLLDYFPDACAAVAHVSHVANEQHNPGKPMHWDRNKSGDEADTMMRHFLERGSADKDGLPHSAKLAWRALALLQKELEAQ